MAKIVSRAATNNPRLVLTNISEIEKNKKTNKFTKNRNTNKVEFGSVKNTIEMSVKSKDKVNIKEGKKFLLLNIIFFLISLCILYT